MNKSRYYINIIDGLRIRVQISYWDYATRSFEEETVYLLLEDNTPEEEINIEEMINAIDRKVANYLLKNQKILDKDDVRCDFYLAYNDFLEKWENMEDWIRNKERGRV